MSDSNDNNAPINSLLNSSLYIPSSNSRNQSYQSNSRTSEPYLDWIQMIQSPRPSPSVIRNQRLDYSEEIQSSVEEDTEDDILEEDDDDSDDDNSEYYSDLIYYKNKIIVKHEQNNDSLRDLFKNIVDQQDKCQKLDNNIKNIQQNEIELHEKYIKVQEKKITKLQRGLSAEKKIVKKQNELIKMYKKETTYDKQRIQCVVCKDNDRNVIFKPCMHIVCCMNCANQLTNNQCPNCRMDINIKERVYIS